MAKISVQVLEVSWKFQMNLGIPNGIVTVRQVHTVNFFVLFVSHFGKGIIAAEMLRL